MNSTARLELPFISPGQAQKELFHNEALQLLDLIVGAAVETAPSVEPPQSPVEGRCYLVGDQPSGAWAGMAKSLAGFTSGGWRFVQPFDGMLAYIKAADQWALFRAGSWEIGTLRAERIVIGNQQVVSARQPAIADPAGGSTIDGQARSALVQILGALRAHGLIGS